MAVTLFKDYTFSLAGLIEDIRRGEIALPDIQRPFVWQAAKVRDLFDSMYKGFPVGYLLFWETGAEAGARQIGIEQREAVPRQLIVDGQQRLTSLFAVLTGASIVRKDYSEGRIRLAFRPVDARFEVTDAAIERDPEFIADITSLWTGSRREVERGFLRQLADHRGVELDREEEDRLGEAIDRLKDLENYPFKVISLDASVAEDQVAEVFVRINSEGVKLNAADFILTLMSVWWEEGRRELERFARAAKRPSKSGASPFNHFIEPSPDQMLRVAVGVAFRRGRLQHVYSILRGKDLDTGLITAERRAEQFELLREAQAATLNLTNWHEFLGCLSRAGFRSERMISSELAVLYTYMLWLIGRRDYGVALGDLREVIARWFFMAHTTGRYTNSPESQIESDLTRLRTVSDASGFCAELDRIVADTFTHDYWEITLPNRLDSSSAKSPSLSGYWAALNLLDAELLFSSKKVAHVLDPGLNPVKSFERHHLFPRKHLADLGIKETYRVNNIGNMAFVDWPENVAIADKAPSDYWPEMTANIDPARLEQQAWWHALPRGWEQLDYDEFCAKRRKLIGQLMRTAFDRLRTTDAPVEQSSIEQLIAAGESSVVEFKSTARWSMKGNVKDPKLEHVIVKTVAGFLNGEGGTLLIGVADDGSIVGLEPDYATLGKPDRDGYELFLRQLLEANLSGVSAMTLVRVQFSTVEGKDVCRVDVAASAKPVFARAPGSKEATEFYARIGNSTKPLVGEDMAAYQREHWG